MRPGYLFLGLISTFAIEPPQGLPLPEGVARIVVVDSDLSVGSSLDSGKVRFKFVRSYDVPRDAVFGLPAVKDGPWLAACKDAGEPVCASELQIYPPVSVSPIPGGFRVLTIEAFGSTDIRIGEPVDCVEISYCGESYPLLHGVEIFGLETMRGSAEHEPRSAQLFVPRQQCSELLIAGKRSRLRLLSADQ